MEDIKIITLMPREWQKYRDLRLKALKEEPQAFGSTYNENVIREDVFWMQRLEEASREVTQWLVFAKLNN